MTVLSTKKPTNNNRDSATNQQQQPSQQPQQPQQQQNAALTRTRPSRDDEHSTLSQSPLNSTEDSDEANDPSFPSSLSPTTTNNFQSMLTTTSSLFANQSKRKAHSHHQHHVHSTISKQARRRCQTNDGNFASASNTNENEEYNSEDEYEQTPSSSTTVKYDRNNLDDLEMRFVRALKEKRGFVIKPVQEDGACLFRAVSDQVFGDEEMHSTVRQNCMDYIVKNADFFRAYITEDFEQYVTRKRRPNCHGNHIEMIALSEIYNRPIEVYQYTTEPINTVHGMYQTDNEPIRLSYHCGVHYNSIVDPWRPTAGHGLGLPDLEPGQAQESLINTAMKESETSHIEKTMLDDKLAVTDWEATQTEIIQQIKRESYLQWLHQSNPNNPTTSNETTSDRSDVCLASSANNFLPLRLDERKDCEFSLPFHYECDASSTAPDLADEDDDDSLMRQVLAMSQIEYVETLNKQQDPASDFDDPNAPSSSQT